MILHIVNKSPFDHSALRQSLRALGEADSLILIEDGVLLLANPDVVSNLPPADRLFVLKADCQARGIAVNTGIATSVDYPRFVELVASHDKSVSWF